MAEKRQSDIDTPEETDNAPPTKIPFLRQLLDHAGITPEVEHWHYDGSGTEADPYVVTWTENDPRNPMLYPDIRKWCITFLVSFITMAVAFCSSAYSGGGASVIADFHCSEELFILGLSLFVLGFALGPLLWAPLSELFGRQVLFALTGLGLTAFNAGAAGSQNIATLSVLRFFAGAIGSSPITNAGGVLADLFNNEQRGLALSLFAAAPFLGPILGPIAGGFIGQTVGWRWIEGVMAILTGVLWLLGLVGLPETYAPVLLRTRARQLSKKTGKVYRTRHDIDQGSGSTSMRNSFNKALLRPWILLFREPIVLLLTIYMAIIYGTLYLLFGAFPIVYQQDRGWSPGIGGLAFIGVLVGMVFAIAFILWDNKRYTAISKQHGGFAPPESRLPPCLIASVLFPISLFWFAWTNGNDVHWAVSIIATAPFGFGLIAGFVGLVNYLIDSYTIFAASVLAGNALLRALFGAAFPLFTPKMYANLGVHWASSIPAFLALACVPFPFLFYRYGAAIRKRCKYSAQAAEFLAQLQAKTQEQKS